MRSPFLLCFFLLSATLHGQIKMPTFRQVGPREGLPEGFVHSIISDYKGIIWIASYEGLFQYNGYECKPIYSQGRMDSTSLSSQRVFSLLEDNKHLIWVGTSQGINRMDRNTGKFKRYQNHAGQPAQLQDNSIIRMLRDSKGRIWASTKKGLALYDEKADKFNPIAQSDSIRFTSYTLFESGGILWFAGNNGICAFNEKTQTLERRTFRHTDPNRQQTAVLSSVTDSRGNIWIGTLKGLFRVNTKNMTLSPAGFPGLPENNSRISSLLLLGNHLWVGSPTGLFDWNLENKTYSHYHYMANNPLGLSTSYINALAADNSGNIWVGTSLSAASFQTAYNPVSRYILDPESPQNSEGNHAPRLYEDQLGNIWTWNGKGILRSNGIGSPMLPVNGTPHRYFLECFLEAEIQGKNTLLMSYSSPGKGLYRYDPVAGAVKKFHLNDKLDNMSLYRVCIDRTNKDLMWIGTWEGVCIYNLKTRDTSWIFPAGRKLPVRNLKQLKNGKWILITQNGYSIFTAESGKQEMHNFDSDSKNMFNSGLIRDIAECPNGSLWIGSETGLSYLDATTGKYKNFTNSNGIKGGSLIYSIHADSKGTCWFVTNSYLINLDPQTNKFRYFSTSDGVSTTFNRWSYCVLRNSTVLFGGISGLIAFDPENLVHNSNKPRLVLTNFMVNNKTRHFGFLPENLEEVQVSYKENAITFEFAALEYSAPEKNEYAYRMQGFDTGWKYSGTERRATYTNLSPGTYYFLVKCTNSEGVWNNDNIMKIKVVITPLYYQTWWFRGLIILAFGAIVWLFVRNKKQQRELEQQKAVAEQNSKYKSKFLTNMSHEIRTPMNAIIGLNRLLLDTPLNEKQKKYAEAVQQSSENLLWIVNDILDQAKIESGKYTMVNKPFHLDVILKQIHNLLLIKAEEKGLQFHFEISNNLPLKLTGDPVRLYQILTNLVANAIKFTQKGQVSLHAESTGSNGIEVTIRFVIKDTGVGIPKDKIEHIFESFNQLDQEDSGHAGTGLGLTIARELVSQMGGEITVESELGKGTTFITTIPFKIDTSAGISVASAVTQKRSGKALRILLVDDTQFNILLAQELLSEQFPKSTTDTAENGKIALEKIQENSYDIVLMDVKMPVMDGIEATRIIRNSEQENIRKLPILGLTANAIPEQLDECYKAGMNDYLTKPVNAQELFTKIDQLTN